MQSELAEHIRSNLLTQALIVVLCVSFSANRLGGSAGPSYLLDITRDLSQ